ncbi:ribonuclease H-like domain-containing protein [Tanacetum coccineum]|uniref:Ribonuclease H-like domain-containing protein n=1 Tax=Tanacetum coccineum TaxID=301880 RepID=A0ABQ5FIM9_9ASTR
MSKVLVPRILTGEKSIRNSGRFRDRAKISNAITMEKNPMGYGKLLTSIGLCHRLVAGPDLLKTCICNHVLHGYSDGEYDDGSDVDNVTLISKLNVSHPLHLHPNDYVALTVVSMKLKGTQNYQVWSCAMLLALEGKNKTGFIDSSYRRSNTYEVLRRQLDRETLPYARSAYTLISSEESHRIATGSVSGTTQRPNDNRNRRTAGGSTLLCENYGFNGHSINKCFKIIGYPADFRKRKARSNFKGKNISNNVVGSSSSNGFFDEQMATLISLIKENFVNGKGIHSNIAGTYMNSSTMFYKNFEKFFYSNSSLHSKLVSKGLITNSDANQHITYNDKNLINVIDISYLKIKVTHPNGTEAFITRIGNIPLTDCLTLYDLLVVPEYCVSLMSIHKVARDSKFVIAFDEMHCYVMNQDLRRGKILGTGKQIGGLYYFNGNQAKQTREPFPFSDHVSTELGELVHLDLWGPYKVTSREGIPTSVLNGKSPYDQVYNKPLSLKHLRSFGCLAYATIQNNHGKFESRSEKDVKFFEDIFPFKQKSSTRIDKSVQDVDHLNFFNFNTLDDLPKMPNDEERRNPSPIRHDDFASENESFAADEDKNNNSEGNGLHDQIRIILSTVRCLINLVIQSGWSLFQIDINNAFVYGDLEEIVYMTLPPGYFPAKKTKVCKLNKSLYGLKHAPRKWNAKLTAALLENNFMQSKSDYSLFTKSFGDVFIALLVYVDDIIITGNSLAKIEKVKQFLKTKFMIKHLGKLKYFLGIEVLDTPKGICLNQRKYCLELIDEFRLLAGKPSNLSMQPNISLTSEPSDTDPLLDNVIEYQKLIGKLIYLTTTRPDIAYKVSYLSQFMHNPLKSHLKTALKVIMYLKGSSCKGINVIKRSASSIDLKAYSGADWARCADTRRSITGYYVFMCGSLVSWKSKKQNTILKSSTEAV